MTLEEAVLVLNCRVHPDHSEPLPSQEEFLQGFSHTSDYEDAWLFMSKVAPRVRTTPTCYMVHGHTVIQFIPHLTTPADAYEKAQELEQASAKR